MASHSDRAEQTLLGEVSALSRLAGPIAVGMASVTVMEMVDLAMVAPLGTAALGALAIASTWSMAVTVAGFGMLKVLEPLVAQAVGAQDRARLRAAWPQASLLAAMVAVPIVALHFAAGWGLRAFGVSGPLLVAASHSAWALAVGMPAVLQFEALRTYLQGLGRVRVAMLLSFAGIAANGLADAVLIYGLHFGVVGCCLATACTQWLGLFALIFLERRELEVDQLARSHLAGALRLAREGVPLGLQAAAEVWAYSLVNLLVARFGPPALAANSVAANLVNFVFMAALAISEAVATRVGYCVGGRRSCALVVRAGWWMAAVVALSFSGAMLLYRGPLARAYSSDPVLVDVLIALLPAAAFFSLVLVVHTVALGALRGKGDLRLPSLISVGGMWGAGLPLAVLFGFLRHHGIVGAWTGLAGGIALANVFLILRLFRGVVPEAANSGQTAPRCASNH